MATKAPASIANVITHVYFHQWHTARKVGYSTHQARNTLVAPQTTMERRVLKGKDRYDWTNMQTEVDETIDGHRVSITTRSEQYVSWRIFPFTTNWDRYKHDKTTPMPNKCAAHISQGTTNDYPHKKRSAKYTVGNNGRTHVRTHAHTHTHAHAHTHTSSKFDSSNRFFFYW